jgi:hypothetical protein
MRDKLEIGEVVETIKPLKESSDWDPKATRARRWNVTGTIVDVSNAHGVCYQVLHKDPDGLAWYERRELQCFTPGIDYSPEERALAIQRMEALTSLYYGKACAAGVHAFIEFAGLMREFIKVCVEAHKAGHSFPIANTHSGYALPFQPHHLAYIAEKLNCIYGPSLLANEKGRRAFIDGLFDGAYKLVPVRRLNRVTGKRDIELYKPKSLGTKARSRYRLVQQIRDREHYPQGAPSCFKTWLKKGKVISFDSTRCSGRLSVEGKKLSFEATCFRCGPPSRFPIKGESVDVIFAPSPDELLMVRAVSKLGSPARGHG